MACQVGFTSIVQTSYQDERIFPFEKKATSANIVILVSKFFTIGVAFVNELSEPIPIVIIIALAFLAVLLAFGYPSKSTLDQMTEELR